MKNVKWFHEMPIASHKLNAISETYLTVKLALTIGYFEFDRKVLC